MLEVVTAQVSDEEAAEAGEEEAAAAEEEAKAEGTRTQRFGALKADRV
jgi:hypothetical protein